jgi:hypothetical protein
MAACLVRLMSVSLPEEQVTVMPATEMTASSFVPGTAPPCQLAGLLKLKSPPFPFQSMTAGAMRDSRDSRRGRTQRPPRRVRHPSLQNRVRGHASQDEADMDCASGAISWTLQ